MDAALVSFVVPSGHPVSIETVGSTNVSRSIAAGALWLVIAQAVLAVGQVAYTAITSRLLAPEAFGVYAVALSATGFLGIAYSGFPAAVLARADFSRRIEASFQCMSWIVGLASAGVLIAAAPLWTALWGSESSIHLTRILAVQMLVAAPTAVQLALLRREGRTRADAMVQAFGGLIGFAVGAGVVAATSSELALAVNPVATAASQWALASGSRRSFLLPKASAWHPEVAKFAANIALQNLGFFIMLTAPQWTVSRISNDNVLGHFSRAWLIVALPAMTLGGALTRALQPHYRHFEERPARSRALSDAVRLTAALSFTPFAVLAVNADQFTRVVLGTGWDRAGALARPLAAGFGLYVVFTVLASAAETFGEFSAIRIGQAVMAIGALVVLSVATLSGKPNYAAWSMLTMSAGGLLALVASLNARVVDARILMRGIAAEAAVAVCIGAFAWMFINATDGLTTSPFIELTLGSVPAALLWVIVTARRPAAEVASRRGILPRFAQPLVERRRTG